MGVEEWENSGEHGKKKFGNSGTVGTEDQRNSRNRGNSGYRGPEEQ